MFSWKILWKVRPNVRPGPKFIPSFIWNRSAASVLIFLTENLGTRTHYLKNHWNFLAYCLFRIVHNGLAIFCKLEYMRSLADPPLVAGAPGIEPPVGGVVPL